MKVPPRSQFAKSQAETRLQRADRRLHWLRSVVFYVLESREAQVARAMDTAKTQVSQRKDSHGSSRGPYSGMTRGELAKSGTCEPDWF